MRKIKHDITLNSKAPIPALPGLAHKDNLRPPPKILNCHRDTFGYSPSKVRKMIEEKREYDRKCEEIDVQREVAAFESRLYTGKKNKFKVPNYPKPPKFDKSVVQAFEPPEEAKFYDFPIPKSPDVLKARDEKPMEKLTRCEQIKREFDLSANRNKAILSDRSDFLQTRREKDLPYMIGNSYWNILDCSTIPSRPRRACLEPPKRPQFMYARTGPRPGGIPLCVEDLVAMRLKAQALFEREMANIADRELAERETLLKNRSQAMRSATAARHRRTRAISQLCGQRTTPNSLKKQNKRKLTKEEIRYAKEAEEEAARLKIYDDKLYEEYKRKKNPLNELERFMIHPRSEDNLSNSASMSSFTGVL